MKRINEMPPDVIDRISDHMDQRSKKRLAQTSRVFDAYFKEELKDTAVLAQRASSVTTGEDVGEIIGKLAAYRNLKPRARSEVLALSIPKIPRHQIDALEALKVHARSLPLAEKYLINSQFERRDWKKFIAEISDVPLHIILQENPDDVDKILKASMHYDNIWEWLWRQEKDLAFEHKEKMLNILLDEIKNYLSKSSRWYIYSDNLGKPSDLDILSGSDAYSISNYIKKIINVVRSDQKLANYTNSFEHTLSVVANKILKLQHPTELARDFLRLFDQQFMSDTIQILPLHIKDEFASFHNVLTCVMYGMLIHPRPIDDFSELLAVCNKIKHAEHRQGVLRKVAAYFLHMRLDQVKPSHIKQYVDAAMMHENGPKLVAALANTNPVLRDVENLQAVATMRRDGLELIAKLAGPKSLLGSVENLQVVATALADFVPSQPK